MPTDKTTPDPAQTATTTGSSGPTSNPEPVEFQGPGLQNLPPDTTPKPSPAAATDGLSGPGESTPNSDEQPEQPSTTNGSSPTSSTGKKLTKEKLTEYLGRGVDVAGKLGWKYLARTEEQQAVGLYIADEEDAANIARPVASMLTRRGVSVPGGDPSDVVDLVMGVVGYGAKQFERWMAARELRQQRKADTHGTLDQEPAA